MTRAAFGFIEDKNMKPPEGFVDRLKAYDPKLDVAFIKCDRGGSPVERWQVTREAADGRQRHIMFVCGEGFSFRPLDNRVLDKLAKCDSSRYLSRQGFMNALGMKEDQDDPYLEAWEEYADRRYHADIEELADRLRHATKDDPIHASHYSEEALQTHDKRARHAEEVEQAWKDGKGIIVWDHELGCEKVVGT